MSKSIFVCFLWCFICSGSVLAQSFYKEKDPKTIFYQVGIGAGTFFAAPRPSYDSIVNQKLPVISFALGKQFGSHLSVKSTFSFQPFISKEFVSMGQGIGRLEPMFNGYSYAFDITPTVNMPQLFPYRSRSMIDLSLGLGLGYTFIYRTEKLFFNGKEFQFNLIEQSTYIPVRTAITVRMGLVSDLTIEGAFFNTFLDDNRSATKFKKDSDHFGQLNLVYRKFIK